MLINEVPAMRGSAPLESCVPFTTTAGSSSPNIWAVADRALATRDGMIFPLVTNLNSLGWKPVRKSVPSKRGAGITLIR